MRFNLIGPDLPRENPILSLLLFRRVSVTAWTGLICAAIVLFALVLRIGLPGIAASQLDAAKQQLKREQQVAAFGVTERSQLLAYEAAASHFGEVRDSGYTIASQLVKVANVWPDPRRIPASLRCYTPSDDGKTVVLSGVAANYDAYASTIKSLQRRFMVVPSESPKGKRYDVTLTVAP